MSEHDKFELSYSYDFNIAGTLMRFGKELKTFPQYFWTDYLFEDGYVAKKFPAESKLLRHTLDTHYRDHYGALVAKKYPWGMSDFNFDNLEFPPTWKKYYKIRGEELKKYLEQRMPGVEVKIDEYGRMKIPSFY